MLVATLFVPISLTLLAPAASGRAATPEKDSEALVSIALSTIEDGQKLVSRRGLVLTTDTTNPDKLPLGEAQRCHIGGIDGTPAIIAAMATPEAALQERETLLKAHPHAHAVSAGRLVIAVWDDGKHSDAASVYDRLVHADSAVVPALLRTREDAELFARSRGLELGTGVLGAHGIGMTSWSYTLPGDTEVEVQQFPEAEAATHSRQLLEKAAPATRSLQKANIVFVITGKDADALYAQLAR